MKIEILDKIKSTIKIMAYSINKDKEGLIELMKKNGVAVEDNISKGKLRVLLVKLLKESKTFREEYKNWVLAKSGHKIPKETLVKKPSSVEEFGNLKWQNAEGSTFNFDPLNLGTIPVTGIGTTPTSTSTTTPNGTPVSGTSTTTPKPSGDFWDVSLSDILDFAQTGLNTYATSVQSNADTAVVNAAVEKERLKQEGISGPDGAMPVSKKITYVVVGLIAVSAVVYGIYYMNKKK